MTPQSLRDLCPAARQHAYLNAAASSPLPQPVADALRRFVDQQEASGDLLLLEWMATREKARARLARFVGTVPERLGFVPSTSMGLNVVASVWKRRGLREVLTLEGEFPSTTVPFLHHGFRLRAVKRDAAGGCSLEALEAALGPGVDGVVVSYVQFGSGLTLEVERLAALCRAHGVPLALNVSQAVGQLPVEVERLGAEFVCGASYKWMMAGYGASFLYAREGAIDGESLPWAGWLSVPPERLFQSLPAPVLEEGRQAWEAQGLLRRGDAAVVEAGGVQFAPFAALDAALGLLESVGMDVIVAHNRRLQSQLRTGLRRRGFVPNAPDEMSCGICVVPVRGGPESLVRALLERNVVTTPRAGGLRISAHVFNSEEDVEALLAALDALGARPG